MKVLILATVAALAFSACGGGTTPASAPTPVATNLFSALAPGPFTLATCVPVHDEYIGGEPVVGSACGGTYTSAGFILNGDSEILCEAQVPSLSGLIVAFLCPGNPF